MLTPKQRRLLLFINHYIQRHGMCPNYNDMAAAIGAKSRGHITAMIDRLEARGFVRRIPNVSRSIEIVRLEPGSVSDEAHANERLIDAAPALLAALRGFVDGTAPTRRRGPTTWFRCSALVVTRSPRSRADMAKNETRSTSSAPS